MKNKKIQKIKSSTLSRGISLFNLTVTSGARFAGLKVSDLFSSKDTRDKNFAEFMGQQAQVLVDELGKLKGSIMKAGQMLSVYGEHFLPEEVNQILKKLQSDSRPVVWEEMHKVLVQQLGQDLLKKLDIEDEPIAAASMGQVYRGRIKKTGEIVAIKIQYPGVDQAIDSDLKALKSILSLTRLVPMGPSFEEIFKEIKMMLHYESDYLRELETIKSYQTLLQDDPRFIIPKVYEEFSTKRVLVMSFEAGENLDSPNVMALPQRERNILGASFMDLMFTEIFRWRMVQTDPHFGNFKIDLSQKPPRIILLDFGAVRKFPKRYISPFAALVFAATHGDEEACVKAGLELGFLKDSDPVDAHHLFTKICFTAIEGFSKEFESPLMDGRDEGANPYLWGESDLLKKLSLFAKDAIFTFKLRTPPREAVFLDRKMVGVFTIVSHLGLRLGPRDMILRALQA